MFNAAIVTSIEPGRTFYPAEGYHQDYLTLNPGQPISSITTCRRLIIWKRIFPDLYRDDPKCWCRRRERLELSAWPGHRRWSRGEPGKNA